MKHHITWSLHCQKYLSDTMISGKSLTVHSLHATNFKDMNKTFLTFDNNFYSRRLDAQEIPGFTFIQASIVELNIGKRQLSRLFVVESTVHLLPILVPRDLWFWITIGGTRQRDFASLFRR